MYSSRGGSSYQQQGYGGQSSYGQNSTSTYPGSSSSGPDASSQLGMHSRHPSILAASREQDIGGYRSHPNVSGPYGGQYSSLYGAASLSSSQQVSALTAKGTQSTTVEAHGGYGSLRPNSPRYASAEYVPSTSHGYTLKTDRLLAEKIPDYASIDRRQYSDRQSAYMTRDLPSDETGRYSDSVGYAHHQPEIYDRIDQAVLREQILKSQSIQTASHDSAVRFMLPAWLMWREISCLWISATQSFMYLLIFPSFEHDFVEEGNLVEQKEPFIKQLDVQTRSSGSGHRTVWNAKVILMSGLSRSAAEEPSSEKLSDDRVPHMCNLLRFAVLRKDRSFMAIGGPWDPIDGPDPSVDSSSLIQTVVRYARDVTQLDLKSCKLWNRFLEIHYDRVGKDGLFSHKEITVLFVPDLSDCLPLLDAWREQWLAHKKVVAERERQLSFKREKEKSRERKDDLRDREDVAKDVKRAEKQKDSAGTGQVVESIKEENESISAKGKETESGAEGGVKQLNKEDNVDLVGESNAKTEEVDNSSTQENVKPVKKKIVKRIVKQKIVAKKSIEGNESKNVEMVEEAAVIKNVKLEVSGEKVGSSAENNKVKMVTRKKVAKKLVDGNSVQTEEKSIESAVNNANIQAASQDKPEVKSDSGGVGVVRGGPVKKKIIKKIIKRVPKKKSANASAAGNEVAENKEADKDGNTYAVGNAVKKAIEVNISGELMVISDAQPETKIESKVDEVKQKDGAVDEKKSSETKMYSDAEKQRVPTKDNNDEKERSKEKEKIVDQKDRKSADGKDEHKRKSSKEVERKKSEEPPRHPGLILQTKSCRDSKVHSLSLSLDSLLDYTDKDVEESTFELSLFAESMYEMLQYQMGSRIFAFLEKLRVKFVLKRNQRKRQREEADAKKKSDESQSKRLKNEASSRETENTKSVVKTEDGPNEEKSTDKVAKMVVDEKVIDENSTPPKQEKEDNVEEAINEDDVIEEVDEEEDPEEDLEEDEEMQERSPQRDTSVEKMNDDINAEEERNGATAEKENSGASAEKVKNGASGKEEKNDAKAEEEKNDDAIAEKASGKEKDALMKSGTSTEASKAKDVNGKDAREKAPARKEVEVDKRLLEAFRFFDRNRAGYIRLEDMRLILHTLGKYLSHRDIKELAQSALLESSTGRDDRILYEKLVRMTGFGKV